MEGYLTQPGAVRIVFSEEGPSDWILKDKWKPDGRQRWRKAPTQGMQPRHRDECTLSEPKGVSSSWDWSVVRNKSGGLDRGRQQNNLYEFTPGHLLLKLTFFFHFIFKHFRIYL